MHELRHDSDHLVDGPDELERSVPFTVHENRKRRGGISAQDLEKNQRQNAGKIYDLPPQTVNAADRG